MFPTSAADFRPLAVTIGKLPQACLKMGDSLCTLTSVILSSTPKCVGMLYLSMFVGIHMMLSCLLKSLGVWSVVKVRSSPTVFSTMPPAYEERGTTGSSSEVTSLPWWIHLACPQCFTPTVLQTSSDQNWHVLRILTPASSPRGSYHRCSTIASSSMPSTREPSIIEAACPWPHLAS